METLIEAREVAMRAYVLDSFDDSPTVRELPKPTAGPGEVLVRVLSTSVNPYDNLAAKGLLRGRLKYKFPAVIGRDVAGVVEAVGDGVERFTPGDQVVGFLTNREYVGFGSFADYIVVGATSDLIVRPEGLDDAEAGALGLSGTTALLCLDALGLQSGESVLIVGATGGVGSFAVQIAAARGLRVIATARPGEEEDHVRAQGATEVVDWSGGLSAAVRQLAPDGVDGAVDLISATQEAFAAFAPTVVASGGAIATTRGVAQTDALDAIDAVNVYSRSDPETLSRVASLVETGTIEVPVTAVFPFAEIDAAFSALSAGAIGKLAIVLTDV